MKAFIVVAFLAASVAAQSMDLMDLVRPTHRRSMTVDDLLLKEKLGGIYRHKMDYPTYNKDSIYTDVEDLSTVFGGRRGVSVLSLEELVAHPIFREYLRIPLFRQFWEEHPVVFRRYVESPLFQKFWTVPEFQMYFRNPIFFYKYIVPQVQLIAETVVPTTEGIYDYGTTSTSRFNPYSTFGYTPRYNREWSVPMTTYGMKYPTTSTTHYKYLLEKMMNHLNMNKMGQELTETLTDVKMLPNGHIKEETFGKMINPITGQEKITVGDVKLVDEKIVPVQGMNFPLGFEGMTKEYPMNKFYGLRNTETLKNILLKHIILNKLYGDKQVITPSVYRTLFGDHKEIVFPTLFNKIFKHKNVMTPESLLEVFGENKRVLSPEVFETLFSTKKTFTPEIFDTLFGEHKKVLTPELIEILMKGNKHVLSPRVLEAIFGKKVYTPEVYGNLFGEDKMMVNSEEELYPTKYTTDVEYEPFTYNKVNRFAVNNPIVSRMLKNKMNIKTLEKIEAEKMIEEIQKEKIMNQLLKTREYPVESEYPTYTTEGKFRHIPLTYNKPMVGSSIEEILREKEIKY